MAIYLGSTEISPAMLTGVSKIYLGSQLVWSAGLPVGTVYDFDYTGSVQEITLPKGRYKLQCWGAQGGTSYGSSNGAGSKGGYSEGIITLTETTTFYVFVGGQGSRGSSTSLVNGGWNGGGASVGYCSYNSGGTNGYSYPACGGGATDISTVTSDMTYSSGRTNRSSASLLARCIVAGGGAGGSYRYTSVTTTSDGYWSTVSTRSGYTGDSWTNTEAGTYGYQTNFNLTVGATYKISYSTSAPMVAFYKYSGGSYSTVPGYSSGFVAESATNYQFHATAYSSGVSASITLYKWVDGSTSTSNSRGYSNQSQQGGGTSGKGQYPGTQTSAGSGGGFGYGANQETTNYRYDAGAGGGGWYGGGTGHSDSSTSYVNYSGGGSGFVNTSANASSRPSGYTGLQLDSGTTTDGANSFESTSGGTETGHSGNGYARITVIE